MISENFIMKILVCFFCFATSWHSLAEVVKSKEPDALIIRNETSNKNKAISLVRNYVVNHKMTKLRDGCLDYDFDGDSDSDNFVIAVRGSSRYNMCGGDPNVSAVLFYFNVNKKNWQLSTDADSTDGTFTPVK